MTSIQHSGRVGARQTLRTLTTHALVFGPVTILVFVLAHGFRMSLDIAGVWVGVTAWCLLAAWEERIQPEKPRTIIVFDTRWRRSALWALMLVLPVSALDAELIPLALLGGLVLIVTGMALRIWSLEVLGPHFTWTTGLIKGHQLIKHGPYRFYKHPNYLGGALFAAGLALASGTRIGWIPVAYLAVAIIFTARHESAFLRGKLEGYH